MTGLDIEKDQIIEMACLVTDAELNILAEVILTFICLHSNNIPGLK